MIEWLANWIWDKENIETKNFYLYARKEFVSEISGRARVYVTCSTEYKLYINGKYVGRGPNPCYPEYQYYDIYEVSHYINRGKNVIGAICYNYGIGTHCRPQAPGGFLLQLEIESPDKQKQIIFTDNTWRVKPACDWKFDTTRMFFTIGYQEEYDTGKKPVGWNIVGFDDSKWQEAHIIGKIGVSPWLNMANRQIPQLKEEIVYPEKVLKHGYVEPNDDKTLDIATRMYSEKTIIENKCIVNPNNVLSPEGIFTVIPGQESFIVLDFGKEVVGFPVIIVRDGGECTIDIGYSEALDR
ncbi:MAG: alpha-L-rhamnosidase N-terminal domain-containing protein, partial [Armatimonadota bacterium]